MSRRSFTDLPEPAPDGLHQAAAADQEEPMFFRPFVASSSPPLSRRSCSCQPRRPTAGQGQCGAAGSGDRGRGPGPREHRRSAVSCSSSQSSRCPGGASRRPAGLRGAGTTPSTPVALSDAVERAVLRHNGSTAVRPDDRAGPRGAGTRVADNAPITTAASAGFHWADAGFGAAATLALILVLAGLALARAKHHRSHPILN